MADHGHKVNYFMVFIALCVCTAISVALDLMHMTPALLVFLVLAVAVAKATFVMTYFMHLKFEGKWKYIILMPTAILAVGLMFALAPDMAMNYYRSDAPQAKMTQSGHHPAGADHSQHAERKPGREADHGDEEHH